MVAVKTPPGLGPPHTPPPLPSAPASIVLSQPATPKAQQASSSVAGQQALGLGNQILGDEGLRVLREIPRDENGFAFMSAVVKVLGETLDQTSSSTSQQVRDMTAQVFKTKMDSAMDQLRHAYYPPATGSACVPVAAPKAPPYEGVAASAPPPVSILPAGMPPLPIQGNVSSVRGRPVSQTNQEGTRGRSGSSESSSPSPRAPSHNVSPTHLGNAAASSGLLPPGATCRVCGGTHDEINCPYLTMNQQPVEATSSHASVGTRNYADEEDETIRVESLSDLTLPNPPKDAAQARSYVNQVLMSIGKLQKTHGHGHEVYAWAQDCLTQDEAILKADPRFPRTDREIAAKLIKTCKSGRFGILFQQMVEAERADSGGMPCGRVMLRMIFKHFQLERDRLECWENVTFFN